MPEETAEKPKKKRGRLKGSKNKPKKPKAEKPMVEEPQFENKLGETRPEKPKKGEPKVESKPEEPKVKAPKKEEPTPVSTSETALTLSEIVALEAEAKAAEEKAAKARLAAEAIAEKEYQAAAAEAVSLEIGESFSDKYRQDRIFRREMGEPEFWIGKNGLVPPRPLLTKEEELMISRKVQIPTDQTPPYRPEHILSPELGGTSNYERGIVDVKQELEEKLQRLKANPDSNTQQIVQTEEDLKTLDYLYENYYIGMNVFRTAKGGRKKLRE